MPTNGSEKTTIIIIIASGKPALLDTGPGKGHSSKIENF